MQMARMLFGWVAERAPGGGLIADEKVRGLPRCIATTSSVAEAADVLACLVVIAVTTARRRACGLGEGGAVSESSVCGGM